MTMRDAERMQLVDEANLAPSVHNTQPARWRFLRDGRWAVYEDCTRRLAIADPTGCDAELSVGAAIEGMALALSRRGLLAEPAPSLGPEAKAPRATALALRWTGYIGGQSAPDPLAALIERRATYRGVFEAADRVACDRLDALAREAADAVVVTDRRDVGEIAGEFDAVGLRFLRDGRYRSELVSWMRFSANHPKWSVDGLNAHSMALSRIEAMGARAVLSKPLFPVLDRIGLAAMLVAERVKVLSATALVLFHRPASEPPLLSGRRFYRLWLQLTQAGFDLCPMSVLADEPVAAGALCSRFEIAADRRLVNVFRAGIRPASAKVQRARLPAQMLVLPADAATAA